jgi:hypothetical protein
MQPIGWLKGSIGCGLRLQKKRINLDPGGVLKAQ